MTRTKPSIELTEEERAAMERLAERDNELSAFADVLCQLDDRSSNESPSRRSTSAMA